MHGVGLYQVCVTPTLIVMSTVTQLYTSESLAARVAAEVRAHAAKRGLKQKDLAVLLGLSPGQISARFSGRIPFKLEDLDVLARHFGVDAAELMPRRPVLVDTETAEAEEVRRQGLEPRTRWFGVSAGGRRSLRLVPGCPPYGPVAPDRTEVPLPATRPMNPRPFCPVIVRSSNSHVA